MTIYAISAPYEAPSAYFATRESAEHCLATDEWFSRGADVYYIEEIVVLP